VNRKNQWDHWLFLLFARFTRSPVHLKFFLCLLFAASGCRFYCRFWLPLLVAVLQA
jgi:hypothetical protein